MENYTILVEDEPDRYHIPGVHNMQTTLCGFVDVLYTEHWFKDRPCNCISCINALKKIKALRFPKRYFKEPDHD